MRWYREAATRGDAEAGLRLAILLDAGPPELRSPREAAAWYEKASNGRLGATLESAPRAALTRQAGEVERNYEQALRHYKRAADAGYADAYYRIAVLYDEGLGVKRDSRAAVGMVRESRRTRPHRS